MNITLTEMHLLNFKGIKKLSINFKASTFIFGENGTGKTTVFDAFTWLLFGKNSTDCKDFNIKNLDATGNPAHKIEHEVAATLLVDNVPHSLKRIYKEKWVKKRGSEEAEMTGHETLFFYNDVPLSQNEYKLKTDAILNENIAKLITNPLYFNAMPWKERRQVLQEIAGNITDSAVAANNEEFKKLLENLTGKNIAEYKKEIAAKRKKINDELQSIPTRIDESNRSKPEAQDWKGIEAEINSYEKQIEDVDGYINDINKSAEKESEKYLQSQRELFDLRSSQSKMQLEEEQAFSSKSKELLYKREVHVKRVNELDGNINSLKNNIEFLSKKVENLNNENVSLRQKWATINAEEFKMDNDDLCCPTCKSPFDTNKQHEVKEQFQLNFNGNKKKRLDEVNAQGAHNAKEIENIKNSIDAHNKDIENYVAQKQENVNDVESIDTLLAEHKQEVFKPSFELVQLNNKIAAFVLPSFQKADITTYQAQKKDIAESIKKLEAQLQNKAAIERAEQRINELNAEQKKLAQEVAQLEKTEFVIDAFNKAKMQAVEERINGLFQLVKWKMFDTQINGGESETCECLLNGVPFSDVNTAGKINAGIDIINALTKHYKVNAPIFIDNRESINQLIPCESQLINLVVSKDKSLLIQ